MATFEVAIYQTDELYTRCSNNNSTPYAARDQLGKYLEYVFNNFVSGHSVNVRKPSQTISAPVEQVFDKAFYGSDGCGNVTYYDGSNSQSLAKWWDTWFTSSCTSPEIVAADANILLTNNLRQAGQTWYDYTCASEGGQGIADLEYLSFPQTVGEVGVDMEVDSLQTALHELAHAFIPNWQGVDEHNVGRVWYNSSSSRNQKTPNSRQSSALNECGTSNSYYSGKPDYWWVKYAGCTQSYFVKQ